jgi:hypothetical protein
MNGYVPIYVPEAHYREVISYVASLVAGNRVEAPASLSKLAAPAEDARGWNEDLWRDVWPALNAQTQQLLLLLAEHPGEWVPITVLEDALGTFRVVQSTLSSLTKRMKRFGQATWPFDVTVASDSGRATYRMTEEAAKSLLAVAQGA